ATEYAARHGWVETTDEEEEAAGGQESAEPELDPLDGEPVTREKGNPNTFPIRESEIGWILHNSAGDVNYAGHIPDLTDRELLFCLSREFRLSGRVQLKREIRRRLRQRESGEAPDPYPEWTARLRAALKKRSPEEAADDGRPFRPAAGE
ncbi:MAG TPA: hypothetical protein GXX28_06085, partial [Firmicutes bacterium]|nr:hypothetical protein [Bacillota bacterium]